MSDDQKKIYVYHCTREHDWPDEVMFNNEMFKDNLLELSDEQWSIFIKERSTSDGFDVHPRFGGWFKGVICPLALDFDPVLLHQCINLAIEEYCKKNEGKKLKLKEAVKWNATPARPLNYYITFTAEDEETHDVETYQAYAVGMIPQEKTYVETVRVKPKKQLPGESKRLPDPSPPEGTEGSSNKKLCHED